MTIRQLFLDTETRSRYAISLGIDVYTRHAQCLIVTYAIDDAPVQIWLPRYELAIPDDLAAALATECEIIAHNAAFDRAILARCLNIDPPLAHWRCTRAQSYAHGLPGSLESVGDACGLPADQKKLVEDKKLIDTFCVPQAGTNMFIEPEEKPDEWKRFCDYAIRDTESLRAIHRKLPTCNYVGDNLWLWHLDQLVNERGFGLDRQLATAARAFLADAKVESDDVIRENTGQVVGSATQRERLLRYLRDKFGLEIESLKSHEVREWLEHDDLHPIVRVLLEQRLEASKSSGAKYKRALETAGPRDRLRHCIQFNGAGRTGRHAGRIVNPQNMTRPQVLKRQPDGSLKFVGVKADYIDAVVIPGIYSGEAHHDKDKYGGPYEAAALALRHIIVAAQGNDLVTADFKNIESVITAWLAGQLDEIEAFEQAFANPKDKTLDVYRKQFAAFFHTQVADVTEAERQAGKAAKLAFGFGGGVGALVTMAVTLQIDLEPLAAIVLPRATEEQKAKAYKAWRRAFLLAEDFELDPKVYQACDVLKQVYRGTNKAINQMRLDVEKAVTTAIKTPGRVFNVAKCQIWSSPSFLTIQLPSGRRLLYASPRMEREEVLDPDGGVKWEREFVTYGTWRGKRYRRERAWSGLFVENIVQAVANDVLRAAMKRVHADTLSVPAIKAYLDTLPPWERTAICLHVHDEIVLDVPRGSYSRERLSQILTMRESWMKGLPIAVDTWINPRYGKR